MRTGSVKVGFYLRVSAEQQAQGGSLGIQEAKCRAEAARLGYQVVEDAVVREHYSGAYMERPGLSQLRVMVSSGAIDAVVAHAPDRLSRDPLDLLLIVRDLEDSGVKVCFVDGYVENAAEGRLLAYVHWTVGDQA